MASRVQKIMFWDTFKNAKSVILDFFPVAEIGSNIHLLYFSYPLEIYSQFVEWGKKVLSPSSHQWSVCFSDSLLQIAGKHPVINMNLPHHNPSSRQGLHENCVPDDIIFSSICSLKTTWLDKETNKHFLCTSWHWMVTSSLFFHHILLLYTRV